MCDQLTRANGECTPAGETEAQRGCIHGLFQELLEDQDTTGLEIMRLVRTAANQYDAVAASRLRSADLSGPRFGLLMRLVAEERHRGDDPGISPTYLSRCQQVSKNTISTLLRGLEEQGLIERTVDPDDLRGFRIRVSPAGRELVAELAPLHLTYLNHLVSELSTEECGQLVALLGKLHRSLNRRTGISSDLDAQVRQAPPAVPDPELAGR